VPVREARAALVEQNLLDPVWWGRIPLEQQFKVANPPEHSQLGHALATHGVGDVDAVGGAGVLD